MSELSPEARAIVDAARGADDPREDDKRRVQKALAGVLAGGAALASSTAASSVAAAVPGASVAVVKLVAGMLVVGAVGTTLVVAPWQGPAPAAPSRQAPSRAALPRVVEAAPASARAIAEPAPDPVERAEPARDLVAPTPIAAPAPAPGSAATRTRPSIHRPAPSRPLRGATSPIAAPASAIAPASAPESAPVVAPAPSPLQVELGLLRQAQAARRAHDPQAALRALHAHRAQFPRGALTAERQATEVLVLCELGRRDQARDMAAVFLASHPGSPLAERVRHACGGL